MGFYTILRYQGDYRNMTALRFHAETEKEAIYRAVDETNEGFFRDAGATFELYQYGFGRGIRDRLGIGGTVWITKDNWGKEDDTNFLVRFPFMSTDGLPNVIEEYFTEEEFGDIRVRVLANNVALVYVNDEEYKVEVIK